MKYKVKVFWLVEVGYEPRLKERVVPVPVYLKRAKLMLG
jgi:hypothetical protein